MFLRFLILFLITFLIIKAIRNFVYRRFLNQGTRQPKQDLGVDPGAIRDAEFTDISDTEDARK